MTPMSAHGRISELMKTRPLFIVITFLSPFVLLPSAFPQGSLTPPGPPAATMKSLDQIEARTPLAGGTSSISISQPGSYYLTGDLNISADVHGITITASASNVTIDLNGFNLTGPSSGSSS